MTESKREGATLRGLDIQVELAGARTTGNLRLAERLVANLAENVLRYNELPGWVAVTAAVAGAHGAAATATSRLTGGLDVRVAFLLDGAFTVRAAAASPARLTQARPLRETERRWPAPTAWR